MIESVVILAGGRGSRLAPATDTCPKPMIPLANRPMIEYIFEKLPDSVKTVYVTIYHLSERLRNYLENGKFRFKIEMIEEDKPLGTGGALKHLKNRLNSDFFVINGDVISSINFSDMEQYHLKKHSLVTVAVWTVANPSSYGLIHVASDTKVLDFAEKPASFTEKQNIINAGMYIFSPHVLEHLPDKELISIEKDIFPQLAKTERMFSYKFEGYWIDAGTLERFLYANRVILDNGRVSTDTIHAIPENVHLKMPVDISMNVSIKESSTIGPYASVGPDVKIGRHVRIHNSVILNNTEIEEGITIENSIISENRYVNENIISKIY